LVPIPLPFHPLCYHIYLNNFILFTCPLVWFWVIFLLQCFLNKNIHYMRILNSCWYWIYLRGMNFLTADFVVFLLSMCFEIWACVACYLLSQYGLLSPFSLWIHPCLCVDLRTYFCIPNFMSHLKMIAEM
jgi:hypothetical protein